MTLEQIIRKLIPFDIGLVKIESGYKKFSILKKNGRSEYPDVITFHAEKPDEAEKFIQALSNILGPVTRRAKSSSSTPKYFVSFDPRLARSG